MGKKKTIVYIVSRFPSTSQTFVLREIKELESLGYNLKICSLYKGKEEIGHSGFERFLDDTIYLPDIKEAKVSILSLLFENIQIAISRPVKYFKALFQAIKTKQIKIILDFARAASLIKRMPIVEKAHIHAQFAHNPTSVAYFVKLLTNNSFSFTSHAVDIFVNPQLLKEKFEECKFAVTISNYNVNYLKEIIGQDISSKISVIRCGIEKNEIEDKLQEINKSDYTKEISILSIGRMVKKKGLDTLIEAISDLKNKGYNVNCRIIGDGPLKNDLKQLVEEKKVEKEITFLGAQSSKFVKEEFKKANLFVLPCIKADNGDMDGIPVVLMEAMAYRVPVVTTNISGIPELVVDRVTGLLSEPNDKSSLVGVLEYYINNQNQKDILTQNALKHLKNEFMLETNVERLGKLIGDNV